ncbi:sugar transferase [Amycolatopsis azurea]|uniref:sugar transferase n=1 Tax=Amycolatopsis azurea TaxID=36819 RepID=UPI0037F16659
MPQALTRDANRLGVARPRHKSPVVLTALSPQSGRCRRAHRSLGQSTIVGLYELGGIAASVAVTGPLFGWPTAGLVAATVAATSAVGLSGYQWRSMPSVLDDLPRIVSRILAVALFVVSVPLLASRPGIARDALLCALMLLVVTIAARALAYGTVVFLRRRGIGLANTVVVGSGEEGLRIGRALEAEPSYGARMMGFIDDGPDPGDESTPGQLGRLDELPRLLRDYDIGLLIVAFGGSGSDSLVDLLRTLGRSRCEIFVLPRLFEMYGGTGRVQLVDGITLAHTRRAAFRCRSLILKRILGTVLAGLALVVLSPLLAVVAIAVRHEGGPGVIFRQQRIGMDGVPFTLYKFRSLKPVGDEGDVRWNIDNDSRLGPVGRFIRRTSLDELPQLWNIVKGDMFIVGPRPERPHFVEKFSDTVPGYQHRHRVPVGLTGYAVTQGLRGDTSIERRATFDNLYAESWSLWLDVKIVLRTVRQVLRFK